MTDEQISQTLRNLKETSPQTYAVLVEIAQQRKEEIGNTLAHFVALEPFFQGNPPA